MWIPDLLSYTPLGVPLTETLLWFLNQKGWNVKPIAFLKNIKDQIFQKVVPNQANDIFVNVLISLVASF